MRVFLYTGILLALGAGAAYGGSPMPYSKPGLWALTEYADGWSKSVVAQLCVDAATQMNLIQVGNTLPGAQCSTRRTTVAREEVDTVAVCKMNGSLVVSKTVTVFTGDSNFKTVGNATFSPPYLGASATHTTINGKWTGACPANMKPGDLWLPDGSRMHMP